MRRTLAVALSVIVLVGVVSPALAQTSDPASQAEIVRYGSSQLPTFVVEVDNGSLSDVQSWADSDSARVLVDTYNVSDGPRAVVAAPEGHVRASRLIGFKIPSFGTAVLETRDYVQAVHVNYRMARPEPVSLDSQEDWDDDPIGVDTVTKAQLAAKRAPTSISGDGLAHSGDTSLTLPEDVRTIVGVDDVSQTGQGVTVAVIDTGVNTADGRIFGNGSSGSDTRILNESKNVITGETIENNGTDAVEDGAGSRHGTWVASIIAANTTNSSYQGILPDADVLALKALGDDGSGSTADIADAVHYAADQGADVISMSLGAPIWTQPVADAVQYAREQGAVVVVAAGNSRDTVKWLASPADVEGAIAVGAVTGQNASNASPAYFSQIGPDPGTTDFSRGKSAGAEVDVAAPGMEIEVQVATPSGGRVNKTLSGTSMATPIVSAVAGIGIEAHPNWDNEKLENMLRDTAQPIPGAGPTEVGHGMVNASNLVDETEPEQTQREAMTDRSAARNEYYRAQSDIAGGLIFRVLAGRPDVLG